ncbi:triose-phosphate transporter [Verticillium dahliae]
MSSSRPSSPAQVLPLTEKPASASYSLHPAFYIGAWIFFSNSTILFNKWLLDMAGFSKFPRLSVILTCWHLIFATVATQILARTTTLLDNRHQVKMTGRTYLRAVVPIGLLYSGSLVCSNLVYMYLSVAFIQMLKAGAPVAVLFASWAFGVADPDLNTLYNILFIVAGVALASLGEIEFSIVGFMFQVAGIVFEAVRLVMIQVLLKGDESAQKMDPLVSLYYYAPVCAVTNFFVAAIAEFHRFEYADFEKTGFIILILNASVAFGLNVASVFLIGKTSSLVMTLTGILKNILLIGVSVLIWNTSVSAMQCFGYLLALFGLVVYSTGLDQLKTHTANTLIWARNAATQGGDDGRLSPLVRRTLVIAVVAFVFVALVMGYMYGGSRDFLVAGAAAAQDGAGGQ